MDNSNEKKLFKDWFDKEAANLLGNQITQVYPAFKKERFLKLATEELDELEMMARVRKFSGSLYECLPHKPAKALKILVTSLPPKMQDCECLNNGWLQWPLGQYIADYTLVDYSSAFNAMVELTQRFTSEFAIRPYVESYPERIFKDLHALTPHKNPHVRRWCSEGIRPRLPWGIKLRSLINDPKPIIPILDELIDDPEIYVRKSVANNLNDIAKDHPELVIRYCEKLVKKNHPHRSWVAKTAVRTLIKDGHPQALEVLGFYQIKDVGSQLKLHSKNVQIGSPLDFEFSVKNNTPKNQNVLIDFSIVYKRKTKGNFEKTFKGTTTELAPGETYILKKSFPMKQTSIRALYPGKHYLIIKVNGSNMNQENFELLPA